MPNWPSLHSYVLPLYCRSTDCSAENHIHLYLPSQRVSPEHTLAGRKLTSFSGPVGYVLFAEVSSAKLRSKTVGIGICVNWLCEIPTSYLCVATSFALASADPFRVNSNEVNSGGYIGFIFGVLAFLGSVWAFFFIPETKGRTVDECVFPIVLWWV